MNYEGKTDGELIADAIRYMTKWLGTGDAGTTMGGLEALGVLIKEGICEGSSEIANAIEHVSSSIDRLADAISEMPLGDAAESIDRLADAVSETASKPNDAAA